MLVVYIDLDSLLVLVPARNTARLSSAQLTSAHLSSRSRPVRKDGEATLAPDSSYLPVIPPLRHPAISGLLLLVPGSFSHPHQYLASSSRATSILISILIKYTYYYLA